ncbi:hypothetical protein CDES_03700 [Corynebacterium deserti GIMN1.010]|uniref:Uncharacterized protein n=1 Tax=Corynebacterium deserti GIMN1.010 TaxID=931089 RepID=A0A0M4CNP2_9CORY|nr:hypothetical protein [Corynebacterium deserti]ALC05192.1 hypothetical protein CDES_03700 [Corynebacterium deserti GIMN1.010]
MTHDNTPDNSEVRRRGLQFEALLGFLGFFTFIALIQAVINVFKPEPAVWPALLALVMVLLTTSMWRAWRRSQR